LKTVRAEIWLAYEEETGEVRRIITYRRGCRAKPDAFAPFEKIPKTGRN